MKKHFPKSFALLAMLFSTLSMSAKQYCGESMTSNVGWTGNYVLSAEKVGNAQSRLTIKTVGDEIITGFYQFKIDNQGGGTASKWLFDPNDADFNNPDLFSVSADGKSAVININWTTYPTNNIAVHMVLRRNNSTGGSDIFGNTINDLGVSATCADSGETPGEGGEEPEPEPTPDPTVTPGYSAGAGTYEGANYTYVYTNDDAGNVRLWVTFSEAVVGVAGPQFYTDGNVAIDATTTDNKVFYTSVTGKKDGDVVKLRARIPRAGGLTQTPLLSHTVGTESGLIVTEYCNYTNNQLTKNGASITLSWETVDNGDVVITMGNGVGATSCAFRNGGFEGGIDAFVVSADNFTTTASASDYFTFEKVYSGNEARLVKVADLPKGTKIKHIGTGHALSWTVNGNGEYNFPDFIYTYGGMCNNLDAPTNVAITDAGVVTFDLVDGADAYEVHVYQGAVLKHTQDIVSGGTISFVAYADGAYTVKVVAKGAGKGDSEESDGATWNMTAAPLPGSNYCETPADRITENHGACNPLFTWTTDNAGNVVITISASEGNAGETKFRIENGTKQGMNGIFKLNGSAADFNTYFNKGITDEYTYTLTLNNAANKPTPGSVISFSGQIEAKSSIHNDDWSDYEFDGYLYGTKCDGPKRVTVSINDAAMGTATVTQHGEPVTEVTTGSEVTFTATANEGYIFVNWSNGNTNPSFTTTVDAAMHLTANFRALGNIYCNTEMTVDGHTIYVTMKRSAPETYQLIVRSEENLTKFGGTIFYMPTNALVVDLRDEGVLSDDKHTLTGTFTAEKVPYMTTPLYVVFEGIGEKTYQQLTNIEYDVECEDDMTVTGLALDPASVSIMVGGSQALKAIFTPAHAFGEKLEWISSNDAVATVDANGVVKAVAVGSAVITAKLISNPAITATCNITVTNFTAHTFYGYGSQNDVDFAYNLTYNEDGTVTIVADVLTNNPGLGVPSFSIDEEWKDMTKNADGTYTRTSEKTFSVGQEVNCFLYAPYTGGAGRLDFKYIIGSSNERPNVAVTSVVLDQTDCNLLINETTQLTATVNPGFADNKNVTWSSSAENVATVDANGLVTAKSAGTATITVTTADGGKTATCTINVVAALTDATYHANDFFTINGQLVGFNYTITRTPERKLRYEVAVNGEAVVDGTPVEFNIRLNDGVWNDMTKEGTGHFTFESSRTYNDNDPFVGFFYAVYAGGDSRIDIDNYTVGSANLSVPPMVAINESDEAANAALTGNIDAVIGRAFTNAYWQTLSLPFALNEEQVISLFGEGVKIAQLTSSTVTSTDNATFELNFAYVSEIEAATPYLIRPSKEVAKGAVVRDVHVQADLTLLKDVLTTDATMIPVLFKRTFPTAETNYWLAENGYLYGGATDIEAMRAYFTFPKLTAEQASRMRARVVFNENTETSVDNITIDESAVKVIQNGQLIIIRNGEKYNVQGQKL